MEISIETYADMSQIDDATLEGIVAHERETLGNEEYGEYAFCTNPECRRMLSVDDVYGTSPRNYVPLDELEKDGAMTCACPDCNSDTQLLFDSRVIKPILYTDMYRNAYGAILRDGGGVVRGNCVIQATTLRDCFDNINYREGYDWDEFRSRVKDILGIDAGENTPAVNSNRLAINRPFRGGSALLKLGTACAKNMLAEHDEWPSFSCVKFGGRVLPILEGIGHQQIIEDKFGAVIVGMRRFGDFKRAFALPQEQFADEFGAKINSAIDVIKSRGHKDKTKYYKGVALLDEIQKAVADLHQMNLSNKNA